MKSIGIIDKNYSQWVSDLAGRYRKSQIKAAVRVNQEMLMFYWKLGEDIASKQFLNTYGSGFFNTLSRDLKRITEGEINLSSTTIKYSLYFYSLYSQIVGNLPQVVGNFENINRQQLVDDFKDKEKGYKNRPQVVDDFKPANLQQDAEDFEMEVKKHILSDIFSVPWGHHRYIIDKHSDNPQKALFFVRQTIQNGWSRSVLLNFLSTDLYERQGNAVSNFKSVLPDLQSDLAQEMTKAPYCFGFTGITGKHNERLLKDRLLNNITTFLIELGSGFAYVGKEYRLEVGKTENFIDLLFYNLNLSCYVVIEVKIGSFEFADIGQIGGYVVACNHQLRKEGRDNPTIGLLICKEKDRIKAQYALESSSQPIAISEYDLEKFYPEKIEGVIPTIEEIEEKLERRE